MCPRQERFFTDQLLCPIEADTSLDPARPFHEPHPALANEVKLGGGSPGIIKGRPSGEAPIVPIDPELIGRFRHRM